MPKQRYAQIYQTLKERIEKEDYPFQDLLPSENQLTQEFGCSRNTVRRAIAGLIDNGYVQSMQGKGVRNIYQPSDTVSFFSGEIETFREACRRNGMSYQTKVVSFDEVTVDSDLSRRTGFDIGEDLYYILRIHVIDGTPLILNHNYFLKKIAEGLTKEIAEDSVYNYLENTLDVNIVTAKRIITVDKITALDQKYLPISADDYNCVAVMTSHTYDSDGILFEHTESRHLPEHFRFTTTAVRSGNLR